MSLAEKKRGPRAAVARRCAAVAMALAVVLGAGAVGGSTAGAATASAATGNTYDSSKSEPDTWTPGQTRIPFLKSLYRGTTFLDWARPGLVQTVSVRNTTGQTIYVLQNTKAMFVLADMAAAVASGVTAVSSGGSGIATEAMVRAGLSNILQWKESLSVGLQTLDNKVYTDKQKSDGEVQADVWQTYLAAAASLNGDAATVYNGFVDLLGRASSDNPQSALADGDPFDKMLFQKIKEEGLTITNNQTVSIRSDDYRKNLAVWGVIKSGEILTGSFAADFIKNPVATVANELLGVVNIFGVSGLAGQLGFPIVDMYIIRDDEYGVHMTTAPNISWVASTSRISPADTTPSGSISELSGIGYYAWRDMTNTTDLVDDQTLYRMAYNALESTGFDAAGATQIIKGVLTGLNTSGSGFTEQTAAKLVLQPNFRKLVWLEFYSGAVSTGTLTPATAAQTAVQDAVSKAAAWSVSPVASLENAAAAGLSTGGSSNFSVWSQDTSDMYDACVSATWYGVNFWSARKLLQRMGDYFTFGPATVWRAAIPDLGVHEASAPVQVAASILATKHGHVGKALNELHALLKRYGGTPRTVTIPFTLIVDWWDQSGYGALVPNGIAYKIKPVAVTDPPLCMDLPDGLWNTGSQIRIVNYYCGSQNDNTSQRFTFAADGTLQMLASPSGGTPFCLDDHAAPDAKTGGTITLENCVAGSGEQQWDRYADGTIRPDTGFADSSQLCVAVPSLVSGQFLTLKTCSATDSTQQWTFPYYVNANLSLDSVSLKPGSADALVSATYTCGSPDAKTIFVQVMSGQSEGLGSSSPLTCDGVGRTVQITVAKRETGTTLGTEVFGFVADFNLNHVGKDAELIQSTGLSGW